MSTVEQQESSKFPPNVVLYIHQEINRRTKYREELENVEVYNGYDDFTRRHNEAKRAQLASAIKEITKVVVDITKKYAPDIEINTENDEITIANVLAVLPDPEEVIVRKVYHSAE